MRKENEIRIWESGIKHRVECIDVRRMRTDFCSLPSVFCLLI